jgi:hypothetical protein
MKSLIWNPLTIVCQKAEKKHPKQGENIPLVHSNCKIFQLLFSLRLGISAKEQVNISNVDDSQWTKRSRRSDSIGVNILQWKCKLNTRFSQRERKFKLQEECRTWPFT